MLEINITIELILGQYRQYISGYKYYTRRNKMEELTFMNVRGSEETVTPIDKAKWQAIFKQVNTPLGVKMPSNWQPPEGLKLEKFKVDEAEIEHISSANGEKNNKVILNIHGGGYVMPLNDSLRSVSVKYLNYAPGAEVYNVEYRIGPTDKHPAALEDCISAYKWLIEQGYKGEDIILTGESAGGGLILALTLYLKDHNMPLPKGVLAISPWADLEFTTPSRTVNFKNDLLLGEGGYENIYAQIQKSDYAGDSDLKDPYLSPLYGDYKGFPSLLIQVGTYEVLYDDSVSVAKKAEAAGVDVKLTSYYGMSHCFQQLFPQFAESKAAWEEIGEFIKKCFNA